nr:unnamed protein product [Callosobruchus analis]CAI5832139.1 unnamed protein product [Callosobruchus analis]
METKYNIGNNNGQRNGMHSKNKFQMRIKPAPILFGHKNGLPPSPKRMKMNGKENKANILNGKPKLSIQDQRKKLPIFDKRNKLIELIQKHKTLIILGETGSGKTTQIPQFIYSAQIHQNGKIGITQPRRVAAISIATRVAAEIGQGVGELVGYSVRFHDETSKKTKIKFLTDGMLLREAMFDRLLMEYNVIILDEAHERTIHTDVLFGIVKKAQKVREDRNIIIMSATMDVDHFSKYFNNCQAVYIEGRTYPVSLHYTIKPHDDYEAACVATFFKIHKDAPPDHDVLIFLTGQEEIETCANRIRTLSKQPDVIGPPLKIYTLYAAQSNSQQMSVFQPSPANTRKVIISTNIAETSVTISGIKYVIDSGMVKVSIMNNLCRTFHPTTGLEMLKVQKISQEQAWQRTGRAGRDSEGHCYRLYTRSQFELMRKTTVPEIQRANLCTVSLQLLSLGIHTLHFNFIDKPSKESIIAAFELLVLLGATDDVVSLSLTPLGKKMAKFPIDPRYSKILLSAPEFGCLEEALIVVSLISAESILITPQSKREQAQQVRQKFHSAYGDLVTLLNIVREFNSVAQNDRKAWCHEHFINMKNILYAKEIKDQLEEICRKCSLNTNSCGGQLDQLRKCLLTGLFTNMAELHRDKQYITVSKSSL